jgi:hypothetical protein
MKLTHLQMRKICYINTMMRHKKKLYLKAIGLPQQRSPYKEKAEKVLKTSKKALSHAGWKFLKLFEDTSKPHH